MNLTKDQIKLLEQNKIIPPNCPEAQIQFFATVCEKKKLDPFLRQIHLVERKSKDNKGQWVNSYTIQAGIDGMRVIAQRNCKIKSYRRWVEKRDNELYGCCEIDTEDRGKYSDELPFNEYAQTKSDGSLNHFWKQFPQTMIKKCAEESVLRMMAPEDLSGVYGDDEMMQADTENSKTKELPVSTEKAPQIAPNKATEANNGVIEVIANDGELDEAILTKIKEAKTVEILNNIYQEIPEDKRPLYLEKLSTRKSILKANKKQKAA